MEDIDKRTVTITIRISPREKAALDKRTGTKVTSSQFARDALLKQLRIRDTARRAAPRRPNYRQREEP